MIDLVRFLVHQFYTNQFMTAAVVAAPMTAVVYMAREVPSRIYEFVKRQLTTRISFNSDNADYNNAQEFVAKYVVNQRFSRTFMYSSVKKWDSDLDEHITEFRGLTIGYGDHIGWWGGRLCFIERSQEQNNQSEKFKERLTLTFFSRSIPFMNRFAAAVQEFGNKQIVGNSIILRVNTGNYWELVNRLPPRPMETVFTNGRIKHELVEHIREFETRKDWYRKRGTPYHTGILLTGEPGTGKTSLIHAVATATQRSLHYLNLGSVEDDKELMSLLSGDRDWRYTILVIEDADAGGADVARGNGKKKEKPKLTLSAMLNMLDGLLTPDGLTVIATSNHPELIDPALLRPGRFDVRMDIGKLDWPAFVEMANVFGYQLSLDDPRHAEFVPDTGASLRTKLLEDGLDAVFSA